MKKQLKKVKIDIDCLEDDVSFLRNRLSDMENREARKIDNSMKLMRLIVSISLVIIAIACIYIIFFKQ